MISKNLKTLLLYQKVQWLSKDLSLERLRLVRINFLNFKSSMVDCKYRKQTDKIQEILKKLENTEIKSKTLAIYYFSHISKTVNMLNSKSGFRMIRQKVLRRMSFLPQPYSFIWAWDWHQETLESAPDGWIFR